MNGPATRVVYQSTSRKDCRERGLVLQSADIEFVIHAHDGAFAIFVAARDEAQAVSQLNAYDRESRDWADQPASTPIIGDGWFGVFAYAVIVIVVDMLCDRGAFGLDWFDSGKTQAGLIRSGQWWRTVTALTLHADTEHLIGNLFFGALFGLFVGQMLGSGVAWSAILLTGAAGNAMNAYVQPIQHSSIGASTAIFGALGILSACTWWQRRRIEGGWLRRWTPLVGGLVMLAYTGFGGERTDVVAHLTGFLSGVLLGGAYSRADHRLILSDRFQVVIGAASIGLIAICWYLALRTV